MIVPIGISMGGNSGPQGQGPQGQGKKKGLFGFLKK